jgi:hypothetical protein
MVPEPDGGSVNSRSRPPSLQKASTARSTSCRLATAVASTPGAGFDAAVATALRQAIAAEPASPRKDYLLALLGDAPLTTQVRAAHVREARARVAQAAAETQTPEGRTGLEAEVRRRILAARALYPGDEHPLPFVPLD